MNVVVVASRKGGSGKSTLAAREAIDLLCISRFKRHYPMSTASYPAHPQHDPQLLHPLFPILATANLAPH